MKVFNPTDFAALIAIDWADRKHDVCELEYPKNTPIFSVISSKPEAINAWANALKQKYKGKPHNTIIRALAFKWIRILFRCWKTKTAYDESTYLEALKRKGSPLLKYAVKSKF